MSVSACPEKGIVCLTVEQASLQEIVCSGGIEMLLEKKKFFKYISQLFNISLLKMRKIINLCLEWEWITPQKFSQMYY